MRIAFDLEKMQPGCPLVAAALGADMGVANRFNVEDWLVYPTPEMKVYELTRAQLNALLKMMPYLTPA